MADLELARQRISHVVVLMLENRSFDHLLGYLDHPKPEEYDGMANSPVEHGNLADPTKPTSTWYPATSDGRRVVPADLSHSHDQVEAQLAPDATGRTNGGFVRSYLDQARKARAAANAAGYDIGSIPMACVEPEVHVPALATLACEYAVCTRWFSSVPGATWPNRNFLHAATSDASVKAAFGSYPDETIFDHLPRRGGRGDWRIYHSGVAHAMAFEKVRRDARGFEPLHRFAEDVGRPGGLRTYSFIEPNQNVGVLRHLDGPSCSQHPGNNQVRVREYLRADDADSRDFRNADDLVAEVYRALKDNPEVFEKTLLVITYDEHGGFWDREIPPEAVPPDARGPGGTVDGLHNRLPTWGDQRFQFDRLGVRVPAVLVSPWIPPATVVADTLEHASVPATLRDLFVKPETTLTPAATDGGGAGAEVSSIGQRLLLSAREAAANPFWSVVVDGAETLDHVTRDVRRELPDITPSTSGAAVVRAAGDGAGIETGFVGSGTGEVSERERDEYTVGLRTLGLVVHDELMQLATWAPVPPRSIQPVDRAVSDDPSISEQVDVELAEVIAAFHPDDRPPSWDGRPRG